MLCARACRGFQLVLNARRCDHGDSGRPRKLDRGRRQPACRALHEHGISRREGRLDEKHSTRGEIGRSETRSLGERQRGRFRHDAMSRHDELVGKRSFARSVAQQHEAFAQHWIGRTASRALAAEFDWVYDDVRTRIGRIRRTVGSILHHRPSRVAAQDSRRGDRIAHYPAQREVVVMVQRGRAHADAHFARAKHRVGALAELQIVERRFSADLLRENRAHEAS